MPQFLTWIYILGLPIELIFLGRVTKNIVVKNKENMVKTIWSCAGVNLKIKLGLSRDVMNDLDYFAKMAI